MSDTDDPPRILVVCRANVARSPLAAAMLRDALAHTGIEVGSAGVQASAGAPAARGSVELAARRGLDLTGHVSTPVSVELLLGASLVLTMSERHRDLCTLRAAGLGPRTFTLREFDRLTAAAAVTSPRPIEAAHMAGWLDRLVQAAHGARPAAPPPSGPEDIADPIGRDWDHWFALDEELSELIARVAARLAPPRG